MKILVVLTYYHPHWTGLTAYAKRIVEGLVARGHQATVLTSRHNEQLPAEETIGGARVIRLDPLARVSRGVVMPSFPAVAARLIAAHDIVQIHTPMLETALVTGLARALGRPSLVTHQGDLVMPDGAWNQFVEGAVTRLMNWGFQLATHITVHSGDYARHSAFLAPFAHKLDAIYPPVELPPPDPVAVEEWRRNLGLEGKRLVGFAGRFVEEKGFDYLLQAIPLVRARVPDAHFVYAGETNVVYEQFFEQWRHLLEQQRDAVTTLGLIRDQQQLANFYAMCDVFCLPSRTDCFPSVQIEALLSGTPLVTANTPGAREVVAVTGMGRLVRAGDVAALAAGLIGALGDGEPQRPTRAAVRATFSTERSLDQYEALMLRLVREAGPGRHVHTPQQLATMPSTDHKPVLDQLLANEADMAYRRRAPTLIDYLELGDGQRILDCGCGMGVYLMLLGKLHRLDLVGVDGDMSRLHWARREAVPADLGQVDITRLPFANNSFDRVLMSEVLEHIGDDRRAAEEVWRVLRPGGVLALSVPHANYPWAWDPINKTIERVGARPLRGPGPITGLWSNHWRLYVPHELRDVLEGAGFTVEALEEQTHHAFPFIHLLVYSVGKPLIEHNLLPKRLRDSADRFRGERNSGSLLNPLNAGRAAFRAADRRNEQLTGNERTFVTIVVKARKPY
jgi:glycosyltransferase involved in cell wall biosynthesis/SAM-dependent methyltransferase